MTRNRNDHTASPPSMTLPPPLPYPFLPTTTQPPPLSYPPLPDRLTSSYLTSYPSLALLPTHQHPPQTSVSLHTPTTTTQPPTHLLLPYPTISVLSTCPTLLHRSTPNALHTHITTTIHCPTLRSPPSLTCPTISHSVIPLPPPPHPTHLSCLPLPYSNISLVCHTLKLKTE